MSVTKKPDTPLTPEQIARKQRRLRQQSEKIHDDTWEYCVHMIEHRDMSPEAAFNGVALVMRHMLINLRSTRAITADVQDVVRRMVNDFYALAFERLPMTAVEAVRKQDTRSIEEDLPSNLKVV